MGNHRLTCDEIGPNLFELIQNDGEYCLVLNRLTIFDSTGWGLEDIIAMEMLMDYVSDLEYGTAVPIESISTAPQDPYQFVLSDNGSKKQANYAA